MQRLRSSLGRLSKHRLVQNSTWMLAGQGLRLCIQAVYFVLIARALGVTHYGQFVAAASFIGIVGPFATWGAGNILVKNVARNPSSFARYWGAALKATLASAFFLALIIVGLSSLLLPASVPFLLVLEIIAADLLFARVVDMAGQAFQAYQKLDRTAMLQFMIGMLRLVAALVMYVVFHGHATALQWGVLYLVSGALGGIAALRWVHAELGGPDWSGRLDRAELAEGFHFSVTNSAVSINNDVDKMMLARLATLDAAGFYAAGYRVLDVSFVPIRAILYAAYSRFFQAGADGLRGSVRFARKLLPVAAGYGALVGVALLLLAPLIPKLLGPEYEPAVIVVRLLSVLPLLRALQYFAADSLTGADRQGVRTAVQASVAAGNVLLNLWMIPAYGWHGAVWSTLASDGVLALSMWCAVVVIVRGEARSERVAAEMVREATLAGSTIS